MPARGDYRDRSDINAVPDPIPRLIKEWQSVKGEDLPCEYTGNQGILDHVGAKPAVWVDNSGKVLNVTQRNLVNTTKENQRIIVVEGESREPCIVFIFGNGRTTNWPLEFSEKPVKGTGYKKWVGLEGGDEYGFELQTKEYKPPVYKIKASDLPATSPTAPAPTDPEN